MAKQDMGELHKIKWSGETYLVISQVLHMLFNRWDTIYHVTTWCKMQIIIWMAYSNSMHFSDKLSYKILFISSYGLKDMNFARFRHLQQFLAKQRKPGTFLTEVQSSSGRWPAGPRMLTRQYTLSWPPVWLTGRAQLSAVKSRKQISKKKVLASRLKHVLNSEPTDWVQGTDQLGYASIHAKGRLPWTEIRCLAVDKARMNSTVPCTLGHRIENRQSRFKYCSGCTVYYKLL
jgi:hypothetical protein